MHRLLFGNKLKEPILSRRKSARPLTCALCNMFSSTLGRRRKFHQLGIVVAATLFVAGVALIAISTMRGCFRSSKRIVRPS